MCAKYTKQLQQEEQALCHHARHLPMRRLLVQIAPRRAGGQRSLRDATISCAMHGTRARASGHMKTAARLLHFFMHRSDPAPFKDARRCRPRQDSRKSRPRCRIPNPRFRRSPNRVRRRPASIRRCPRRRNRRTCHRLRRRRDAQKVYSARLRFRFGRGLRIRRRAAARGRARRAQHPHVTDRARDADPCGQCREWPGK
jgi:hypothetical protein